MPVDPTVFEMPSDASLALMPPYRQLLAWTRAETHGLTAEQLDVDDLSPDKEWMWWSIRRQVSHMAWDSLVFTHRRCASLLWPEGNDPEPVVWKHHHLGRDMKFDRVLDEDLFWQLPELLDKLELGLSWLTEVVADHPIETLRATTQTVRGTDFWSYVITTLPRGASHDTADPALINYDLEGSLWMVFYEMLSHIRTIQRLKLHQGLSLAVELPRVGYLRLPEYWGDTNVNGPAMTRL
ncbi:MAG: hypothetical protein ACKVHU_19620 [Acidimicrobiales bacterium]